MMTENKIGVATNATLEQIEAFFRTHDQFVIMAHARPDGDAYGSTLGLGLILRAIGKDVILVNQDGMEPGFQFMPGSIEIQATPIDSPHPDRKIITVDVARPSLIGPNFASWNRPVDLNIDHHLDNPNEGLLNYVRPNASSAAEVVHSLIRALNFPLPTDAASALFVGVSTDTGSFSYSCTSPLTFEMAADLARAGANTARLSSDIYTSKTKAQLNLQKEALNAAVYEQDDQVVYIHLTQAMLERAGASQRDSSFVMEPLRSLASIEVSFVVDDSQGITRASLRSRGNVDVQVIAKELGGGGHKFAAGIKSDMPAEKLTEIILAGVKRQLLALPA